MKTYIVKMNLLLNKIIEQQLNSLPPSTKVGSLVSAGIDSSTIATLLSNKIKDLTLITFGTPESKDFSFVDILYNFLKKDLLKITIEEKDLADNLYQVKNVLQKNNIEVNLMQMSLGIGYLIAFAKAKEKGITHIFTGQGPDVILGGYHKYKNLPEAQINQEITKDIMALEIDKKRDQAMADCFGIKLFNPYLEKEFVDFCQEIPASLKIWRNSEKIIEKYILRRYAETLKIPDTIINRPKMAFQYSTRIQKALIRLFPHLHQ